MQVIVAGLTHEAQDVVGLELRDANGGELPAFTSGSHVDLFLPNGVCRQYSLVNPPADKQRYVLGIGLAVNSRGGSSFVHQQLAVGDVVQISEPRSLFGLSEHAAEHCFIAGGIGITPIMSMIRHCQALGQPWRLLYCVRSRSRAAYAWALAGCGDQVQLFVDEEAAGAKPDLAGWLAGSAADAHVYCCGPEGLMNAVESTAQALNWPTANVHFERFAPPEAAAAKNAAAAAVAGEFTVVLHRSGQRIPVAAHQSMLEALEQAGQSLPFSCREGMCRSCELPLLEGEAEHLDYVLSDEERAAHQCILPCVSRARSAELVIDI